MDGGEQGRRYATVLDLMTEDVAFMVPGRAPFGKQAFVAASDAIARDANLVTEQQFSRSFRNWAGNGGKREESRVRVRSM